MDRVHSKWQLFCLTHSQIDWNANPNIRPVCLPDASAGDYDQTLATTTGPGSDGGDDSSSRGGGVSDDYDFEGGGL